MTYFVVEITIPNLSQESAGGSLGELSQIIKSAGGRLVDYGVKAQILILIIAAKSKPAMIDALKINASHIGQIRHIFLLETNPDGSGQKRAKAPSFSRFFGEMDLRGTVAIEVE